MRKLIVGLTLAAAALVGSLSAPAEAQSAGGVPLNGVVAFTQSANYMSIPGYVRYRIFLAEGRWLSRQEAEELVRNAR
jgi:hypothetical protein